MPKLYQFSPSIFKALKWFLEFWGDSQNSLWLWRLCCGDKNVFTVLRHASLKWVISWFTGGAKAAKSDSKEEDLQILQEIPGKSGGLPGISSLSSLLGTASGGSGSGGAFFNPPSILQAQDPFFQLASMQAGGSSSANTLDLLQKCKFAFLKPFVYCTNLHT